jgi:beta-lactamase superfamily II metal-dependent hydrolase
MPFLADAGEDVNENSIVALLRFQDFRELLMGDAGEAAKRACSRATPISARTS